MLASQPVEEVARLIANTYDNQGGPPPQMVARLEPILAAAFPQIPLLSVPPARPGPTRPTKAQREAQKRQAKAQKQRLATLRQQLAVSIQDLPGPSWAAILAVDRDLTERQMSPNDTVEHHIEQIASARSAWWAAHRESGADLIDVLKSHHQDFAWPTRLPATAVLVDLLTDPGTLAAPRTEAQVAVKAYLAQIKAERSAARAQALIEQAARRQERHRMREERAAQERQWQEQRTREQEALVATGRLPDHDRRAWRCLSEVAALVGLSAATVRADLNKGRLQATDHTRGSYMRNPTSLHDRATLRAWLTTHRPKIDPALVEQPTRHEIQARHALLGTQHCDTLLASPRVEDGYRLTPPPAWPPHIQLRLADTPSAARQRVSAALTATQQQLECEIAWLGQAWPQVVKDRASRAGWTPSTRQAVVEWLNQVGAHYQVAWPSRFVEDIERKRLEHLLSGLLNDLVRERPALVPDLAHKKVSLHDPLTWYPQARALGRRWILHVGPTNSGKTHDAMRALMAAPTGIYLAPLRLMALEGFDRMVAEDLSVALVTGEERQVRQAQAATAHRQPATVDVSEPIALGVPAVGHASPAAIASSTHISATIEAGFDEDRVWDVAVIDEAQMFADPERGWAWSQALAGICARQIHVCAAPEARAALVLLAHRLGEPVQVIEHDRFTPLIEMTAPVKLDDLCKGDALVVFSRRQLMGYRSWLRKKGKSVAVLYGDLGPEVRRAQADRFRTGQADILVATDAIGMGLNLPIARVIFAETEKFDGRVRRPLRATEWKQIAGRAGRHGLYAKGFYGYLPAASPLSKSDLALRPTLRFRPTRALIRTLGAWLGWTSLSEVARFWQDGADRIEPASTWGASGWLDRLSATGLSLDEQYRYLGAPVNRATTEVLVQWIRNHAKGQPVPLPKVPEVVNAVSSYEDLAALEALATRIRLYRWCALAFPEVYTSPAGPAHATVSAAITASLSSMALENLCDACGCRLPVGHPHANCDPCYRSRSRQNDDWGWE